MSVASCVAPTVNHVFSWMVPVRFAFVDFGVMAVHIIATVDVPVNVDKRMAIAHRVMIVTGATHVKNNANSGAKTTAIETQDIAQSVNISYGVSFVTINAHLGARTPAVNTQDIVQSVKPDIGETPVISSVVRDV